MEEKRRKVHTGFTIEKEVLEAVKSLASQESRSVSSMVSILIKEALEKRKEND